jgi:hypothetical protein
MACLLVVICWLDLLFLWSKSQLSDGLDQTDHSNYLLNNEERWYFV